MSAIDDTITKIIAEKNDAVAKMEWWRKEAGRRWEQALDLRGKIERLEREIEQLKKRLEKAQSVKVVRIEFAEENRNKKI